MGVFKRGDVWWIDYFTPNGKRVRQSSGTDDKEKALELHDRLKVRHWEEQRLGVRPDRSWQEAAVRWVKETKHKRSHDKDVAKLRYLDATLGGLMLSQVTRDVIDAIGERKAKESSQSNANRYLALIRSILRRAKDDWEWVHHIPKVRLYQERTKRVRWIKKEEAHRLLAELPQHLREMAQFSLCTGLRQSNVSYLKWNQIDMQRKVLWIHADEAKAGRAIAVPLIEDAMSVLRQRLGKHRTYVFTYGRANKPVERCSTKAWHAACKRAGIVETFRWHDLRHTWASWHVQSGTSLQELMQLGSWTTHEMVLRYAHFAADQLMKVASHIDGTFSSQNWSKAHHLRAA